MNELSFTAHVVPIPNLAQQHPSAQTPSPLIGVFTSDDFVDDSQDHVLTQISLYDIRKYALEHGHDVGQDGSVPAFELAGPRKSNFWDPQNISVAIVTCGGLAPGLNNVIHSLVTFLSERYGVPHIYGVPYGYQGFSHDPITKTFPFPWQKLDAVSVQNIDLEGGSILGTSRGHSCPEHIVDALTLRGIQILFTLGGDGTLTGAHAIFQEVQKRKLPISVIGIPKTIDNDVLWVSKTFGFETAVSKAAEALRCARWEAKSAYRGIGLVKLMGRHSGALTTAAAAATSDLDFVLVPEVPLCLEGERGFLNRLTKTLLRKGCVTIAVAEGAGQDLIQQAETEKDLSGNPKLKDIGRALQQHILRHLSAQDIEYVLKYIDPSYMLRAQTTTADDAVFCALLGQNAVHAAMAGKTGCLIGYSYERFTHVPLHMVQGARKRLDLTAPLWLSVLAATGQPASWVP